MVTLRPYQQEAHDAVYREFNSVRRTLLVAATGTGKTTCFSAVTMSWKGRVLILAHRTELVQQAKARLEADLGERVGVDQGTNKSTFERVVVASIQTICQKHRLERLCRFAPPSLIIADEAHHAPARTWTRVLESFPNAKVLGVTATPDRGDGKAMGRIFDSVAYEYQLHQAVEDGWLVPLRGEQIVLGDVNLDLVGTNAGDLAAGQLDEAMLAGAEGVVHGLQRYGGGPNQGIVFCPGVKTAHYVADRLNALGSRAHAVDAGTDQSVRSDAVDAFRRGDIQWLTNAMIFTEGTDLPTANIIAIARPTKSRALYAQMVGRGSRVLPGVVDGILDAGARKRSIRDSGKPSCLVLDFVGNNSRHSLACPEDILGGDYDDEEKSVARKAREAGELGDEATVSDYLASARAQIRAAAAAMRSRVEMERYSFDPLGLSGVSQENEERRLSLGHHAITSGQMRALVGMGVSEKEVRSLTRAGAKKMLDVQSARRKEGLATIKQLRLLRKHGLADPKLTKERASKVISYLAETGWGRHTEMEVAKAMLGGG